MYGAGSLKSVVSDAFWNRGVSAVLGANAVPVAHFNVAQVLYSLKLGWYYMDSFNETEKGIQDNDVKDGPGGTQHRRHYLAWHDRKDGNSFSNHLTT